MRRILLFSFLFLATMPAQAASLLLKEHPVAPPPIRFSDQDGRSLGPEDFKGRVVVLDFWATWCAPCRAEFPDLDRLQDRFKDKGLVVVAVSIDRNGARVVDQFFDELKIGHLGKYFDPASKGPLALGLAGLPTTLILDRQGREAGRVEGGADWNGAEMTAFLTRLLAEK